MADQTPQTVDLTPEVIHLEVQQGTDNTLEFQLTDNDGVAVDLTLDAVKFTAKDGYGGTVTIATKTNTSGSHSDPTAGKTLFVLTKTDLTVATPDAEVDWVYEIRRVFFGTNREVIYIHGDLRLMPSVGLSA